MNVLITCIGRRYYLAEFFKATIAQHGRLIGSDMSPSAPALTVCDKSCVLPAVTDKDYISKLIEICIANSINYVFSVNDLELSILAENKTRIYAETGAVCVISSVEVIDICGDKYSTFHTLKGFGVSTPRTFTHVDSVIQALKAGIVAFPLMVKPRWGSASIGLNVVYDVETLRAAYDGCARVVNSGILSSLGSSDDSRVIIQEFIQGPEFGLDILNGLNGEFIGVCAKRKLAARAGETDKAVTVDAAMRFPSETNKETFRRPNSAFA